MVVRTLQIAFLALLCTGCARSQGTINPPVDRVEIYLVRFGWHADLVIPTIPCDPLPDEAPVELREASRILVGWGDARYYPLEDPGAGALLRAALVPSASALMLFDIAGDVARRYSRQDVLRFEISQDDCRLLGAFVRRNLYVTDDALVEIPTDRPTAARFFLGTEQYHLFRNCNHWMAAALRAAGLDVRPWMTPTVGLLWRAIRDDGHLVASRQDGD